MKHLANRKNYRFFILYIMYVLCCDAFQFICSI